MKKHSLAASALLGASILVYAPIADARVVLGVAGYPTGNPTATNVKLGGSDGSVVNVDTCETFQTSWLIPLTIDATGSKSPVITGRQGTSGSCGGFAVESKCRGHVVGQDGTILNSTGYQTFTSSTPQTKTLAPMTVAANQGYLVGCYIGGNGGTIDTVSYTP